MSYTDCLKRLKPATVGSASIVVDEPSKFERLQGAIHGQPLTREKYVRLLVGGKVMMTDAEFERRSNLKFLREVRGECLIGGLGIGLILEPAIRKCKSVTVVEINPDVIALVGPQFPEVRVVQGDITAYKPDQQYDTIYLDIWDFSNDDKKKQATKIKRRLRKYLRPGGWMGDWASESQKWYRR